MKEVYEESSRV